MHVVATEKRTAGSSDMQTPAQPEGYFRHTAALAELVRSNERRAEELDPLVKAFMFVIPQVCSPACAFR